MRRLEDRKQKHGVVVQHPDGSFFTGTHYGQDAEYSDYSAGSDWSDDISRACVGDTRFCTKPKHMAHAGYHGMHRLKEAHLRKVQVTIVTTMEFL